LQWHNVGLKYIEYLQSGFPPFTIALQRRVAARCPEQSRGLQTVARIP